MIAEIEKKIVRFFVSLLIVSLFLLQGCPIALVAIIAAYSGDGDVVVTAEVPRSADEVFAAAKKRVARGVSEQGIPYKVTSINEDKYTIALVGDDGSWSGEFLVVPLSSSKCQIVGQGVDKNRSRAESEHHILLGIENVCKDLGVEYTVIERNL